MRLALLLIALCLYDVASALRKDGDTPMPKSVGGFLTFALLWAIIGDIAELVK